MRVYLRRYVATALTALMVAGCSGSGGNPVAPIQGGAVPTATPTAVGATATPTAVGATATPTGVAPTTTPSGGVSATPSPGSGGTATPTPGSGGTATPTAVPTPTIKPTTAPTPTAKPTATPAPTPTPAAGAPTPLPTGSSSGDTTCSAANENVPGIYTSVVTNGSVTGSTYTGTSGFPGSWSADYYTTPSPTPLPTATVTPIATPTPFATPTPLPTATPTPQMYTLYNGTYFVPSFSGTSTTPGIVNPYTASQTTGCFTLVLIQAVGGTAGQFRRDAATAPVNEAIGFGDPGFLNDTADLNVDAGQLASFTMTDLTTTSGNGTFTFVPSGGGSTVHGTATITGSDTVVFSGSRRVKDALHKYYMLYKSAQWYGRHLHHV